MESPPTSPTTWTRLCPLGEWRDPVVEAVEAHLARPVVRETLRRHERDRSYPGDVIAALRERGLPELFTEAPRVTAYHLCDLNAVTARAGGSLAISVAIPGLALLPLYIAGCEDQRQRAFSLLRQGEMAALLLTEWGHGSDLARIETRAEAVDDGFSLVGEKHMINGGTVARLLVTLARTGDGAGGDGPFSRSSDLSVLLVERDDTVEALPAMPTLPVPGADISGVRFHGTPVGTKAVIGEVGEGFSIIQRTLILSRGGIASLAAGTATAAWDACWSYARERRIYGAPILELGAIRDHLLRVAALDALSSALAGRCAAAMNAQGQAAAYVTATAKFACCALAEEAVTEGRHLMGARAFLEDQPYARLVRDVPLYGVFDGTSHIMLGQIRDHLGQMVRQSDVGPEEVLERTRALYGTAPRSFLAMEHRRRRARVLPPDVRARALDGLPGAVDLEPLAAVAGAMVELVPELQAGGRWTRDQGAGSPWPRRQPASRRCWRWQSSGTGAAGKPWGCPRRRRLSRSGTSSCGTRWHWAESTASPACVAWPVGRAARRWSRTWTVLRGRGSRRWGRPARPSIAVCVYRSRTRPMADESPLMIRIRRHVARICAVDPSTIRGDGKLAGYGLDSIRAMELILTLEEQLDIEIPEHDPALARVETLRDLVQLVRRRSEENNP